MKTKSIMVTLACWLLTQGSAASTLWLGYGQSSKPKQGDLEGRGYKIEDYPSRFINYTGSVALGDKFGINGFLDQNEDNETVGYMVSARASTHALEFERGWQSGALTFEDVEARYRSELLRAGIFEYAEDAEGLEIGLVYHRQTKPSVFKADGVNASNQRLDDHKWLDPEMKYELYGFELRYDSVRKVLNELMASGKGGSYSDWYFSFNHIQGVGRIRTSNAIGKPNSTDQYKGEDEWWGILAAKSRYKFGGAHIRAGGSWAMSVDVGYFVDVHLPLGLHKDIFTKDAEVPQQERFSHGWEARVGVMF